MWYGFRQCSQDITSSPFVVGLFARKTQELEVFGFTIEVRLECIPRFITEHIFYRRQTEELNTAQLISVGSISSTLTLLRDTQMQVID